MIVFLSDLGLKFSWFQFPDDERAKLAMSLAVE
jgi:hypothetical protein